MAPQTTHTFPTESEAAEYLGISKKTLQRWRFGRRGPNYVRVAGKLIRYHQAILDAWMDQQTIKHENGEQR